MGNEVVVLFHSSCLNFSSGGDVNVLEIWKLLHHVRGVKRTQSLSAVS